MCEQGLKLVFRNIGQHMMSRESILMNYIERSQKMVGLVLLFRKSLEGLVSVYQRQRWCYIRFPSKWCLKWNISIESEHWTGVELALLEHSQYTQVRLVPLSCAHLFTSCKTYMQLSQSPSLQHPNSVNACCQNLSAANGELALEWQNQTQVWRLWSSEHKQFETATITKYPVKRSGFPQLK